MKEDGTKTPVIPKTGKKPKMNNNKPNSKPTPKKEEGKLVYRQRGVTKEAETKTLQTKVKSKQTPKQE